MGRIRMILSTCTSGPPLPFGRPKRQRVAGGATPAPLAPASRAGVPQEHGDGIPQEHGDGVGAGARGVTAPINPIYYPGEGHVYIS